jgi:hypothetical protein
MKSISGFFTSMMLRLPPGLRVFAMIGMGGLALAVPILIFILMRRFPGIPTFFWIILGVALIAIIGAVVAMNQAAKKRKARQADAVIREGAVAGASNVKNPDEIARLDQLRKDFLAAYNRFTENNEAGIYSLPFLMLVGEPGSGKTEAIRHSNINFPAGLNKPSQGAGGTYNMDWWFASDAIILDTAGRLMFEETQEWNELLQQLNRVRPHCPINGLLLVIPADSLLTDSAEVIERKGDRIAQQINIIKRELGIRFPVFVIVTKCDLVTGFREYFSHLTDPALQHQILGWSNPSDLDEPFKPELVEKHLEQVQQRLRRRRLALLLDPPDVDLSGRRIDQVDALYAFPEELMRLKSRLQLYMEKVFTPGPWTKKPPFVRGIYFTSSMQEGKEIDTALAEMLSVKPDELPGRSWQKDKAMFLKDLFLQKVFPEQGLVSRAANAVKNYQRNRMIVHGTGTAAIVLSLLVVIFTLWNFGSTIGESKEWWQRAHGAIAHSDPGRRPQDFSVIVRATEGYQLNTDTFTIDGEGSFTPIAFLERSGEKAAQPISPSFIMRPITKVADLLSRGGDPTQHALETHQYLVTAMLLSPVLNEVRARLAEETDWQAPADEQAGLPARALAELTRLERIATDADSFANFDAGALLSYAARNAPPNAADVGRVNEAVRVLGEIGPSHEREFARRLGAGGPETRNGRAVLTAIRRWRDVHAGQVQDLDDPLSSIQRLSAAVADFETSENDLWQLADAGDQDCVVALSEDEWSEQFQALRTQHETLNNAVERFKGEGDVITAVEQNFSRLRRQVEFEYDLLLGHAPSASNRPAETADTSSDDDGQESAGAGTGRRGLFGRGGDEMFFVDELTSAHGAISEALNQVDLESLKDRRRMLSIRADGAQPAFALRFELYEKANEELSARPSDNITIFTLASVIEDAEEGRNVEKTDVAEADKLLTCVRAVAWNRQVRRACVRILQDAPRGAHEFADRVRVLAEEEYIDRSLPPIPLSRLSASNREGAEYRAEYAPGPARRLLEGWARLKAELADRPDLSSRIGQVDDDIMAYHRQYCRYWTEEIVDDARPRRQESWSALKVVMAGRRISEVHNPKLRLLEMLRDAGRGTGCDMTPCEEYVAALRNAAKQQRVEEDFLRPWLRLSSDAIEARAELLRRMRDLEFARHFCPIENDWNHTCLTGVYWNDFINAAIDTIVNEIRKEAITQLDVLRAVHRRFPIAASAEQDLTPEQAEDVRRAVAYLVQLYQVVDVDPTEAAAARCLSPEQLNALRNPLQLSRDADKTVRDAASIFHALLGAELEVRVDPTGGRNIMERFEQLRVTVNGRESRLWLRRAESRPRDMPESIQLTVPLPGVTILDFSHHMGDTQRQNESDRWWLLRPLAREQDVHEIKVDVEGGALGLYLKVSLPPELGERIKGKKWPDIDDWRTVFRELRLEEAR